MDIVGAAQPSNYGPGSGDISDVEDPGAHGGAARDGVDEYAQGGAARDEVDEYETEAAKDQADVYDTFSTGMFKAVPASILGRPDPAAPTSSQGRRRSAAPSRSSTRLAARASPFPVAERAQRKLMRELAFLNNKSAAPDAAVTAYIDLYGDGLPDNAVKAIRAATRMGNRELAKALEAIAAESGAPEMEVA
jgi:hypothetical protein